jgi:hypothetical protein
VDLLGWRRLFLLLLLAGDTLFALEGFHMVCSLFTPVTFHMVNKASAAPNKGKDGKEFSRGNIPLAQDVTMRSFTMAMLVSRLQP